MQLLVRMPNWIGDAVMAIPTLRRLASYGEVSIVAKPHIETLLQHVPFISHREGPFDAGVLLTNSFSSAWDFFRRNLPRRIGFRNDMRSLLLTDPISFPKDRYTSHLTNTYQNLLAPLNITPKVSAPELFLADDEKVVFSQPTIGFHTGAAYGAAKCWPKESYYETARRLTKKGYRCVFFGHEPSQDLPKGVKSMEGKTTLRELMAYLAACDLVITNDSGPMHVADALGTKVISIFGSTEPRYTGPFSNISNILYANASCSPCFKRTCPIDFRCMHAITVEHVVEKALALCESDKTDSALQHV